jgi:fimbrial chaperone protein
MNMKLLKVFISLIFLSACSFVYASSIKGVSLSPTRVIVFDEKVSSIKFNNNTTKELLLRAWISEYDKNERNKSFVITPPLYRIDKNGSMQFRIENIDNHLPQDRESVFHINILAIPPKGDGNMQVAINSRVKLFYRPALIAKDYDAEKLGASLVVNKKGNVIRIINNTPFNITLDHVKVDDKPITTVNDFMVKANSTLNIPVKYASKISYTTINDYGGNTTVIEKRL